MVLQEGSYNNVNYPSLESEYDNYNKINQPSCNTKALIILVKEIIGEKVVKQSIEDQSYNQKEPKNYSKSHSKWYSNLFSSPLFVDRSINIGNSYNSNNVVHQSPRFENKDDKKKREEKEENDRRVTIGIVAGIAMLPLTYVFGRLLGTRDKINNFISNINDAKKDWKIDKNNANYNNELKNSIDKILRNTKIVLNKQLRRNTMQLAVAISFLGSCILGVVGAVVKSTNLVNSGLISGGVVAGGSALYFLFNLGYNHGRPGKTNEIETIKNELKKVEP